MNQKTKSHVEQAQAAVHSVLRGDARPGTCIVYSFEPNQDGDTYAQVYVQGDNSVVKFLDDGVDLLSGDWAKEKVREYISNEVDLRFFDGWVDAATELTPWAECAREDDPRIMVCAGYGVNFAGVFLKLLPEEVELDGNALVVAVTNRILQFTGA